MQAPAATEEMAQEAQQAGPMVRRGKTGQMEVELTVVAVEGSEPLGKTVDQALRQVPAAHKGKSRRHQVGVATVAMVG